MANTYLRVYSHLIFAVQNRKSLFDKPLNGRQKSRRPIPFVLWAISLLLVVGCVSPPYAEFQINSFKELDTPSRDGGAPNLFVSDNDEIYLSWLEYVNDSTDALLFSKLTDGEWKIPKEIARGSNWFSNWADFPSLISYKGNGEKMAAHWLQKSAYGTYDYDVRISQSGDGGENWKPPFIPHKDGISAEHGFVTMIPLQGEKIFAVWLDGRNTKKGNPPSGQEGGHTGAMTLRTCTFDTEGNMTDEFELDDRICDCCQTTAAMTSKGLIVAYRDRSEEEVRDISIVRLADGDWTNPEPVHEDNWKINGCPVNGPSLDAEEEMVAISWFTMVEGEPQVKVAFSNDGGESFSDPVRIDNGNPLGRVDVVLWDHESALASWLEQTEQGAEVRIIRIYSHGKKTNSQLLVKTANTRQSGFPIIKKSGDQLILAWTEVNEEKTRVKTAVVGI